MKIVACLALALLLTACGRSPPPSPDWQLETVNGTPFPAFASLGMGIAAYTGQGPCNSYAGRLSREPFPSLTFGRPKLKGDACAALGYEQVYLDQLQQVRYSRVAPGRLTLVTDAGVELAFRQIAGAP
ncbi:hypothetical protein OG2516_08733 [Oceanicola granulosus HTCC2516]|uniref:DUF306 domain-containing protein n=1 Tax=Oceanicola granulosus (strain ATCC BAA-861 / DSM 15982 / KCTC 12143 / HTCC2516) TaxID=314256 RepID=Q2CAQ6_OCEGH|nr:META domain-containing protein [Oceanicola granulosus]EAR49738.1 hypothetical protein OG2516_08733 [Oceanicola granulosus HTCC2516]